MKVLKTAESNWVSSPIIGGFSIVLKPGHPHFTPESRCNSPIDVVQSRNLPRLHCFLRGDMLGKEHFAVMDFWTPRHVLWSNHKCQTTVIATSSYMKPTKTARSMNNRSKSCMCTQLQPGVSNMQWLWCYGLNLRFLELRLPLFDYTWKELNGSALFWWIVGIPWVQTGRYQIVVRRLSIFASRISRNQSNVSFKISFHLKIHFVRMGLPRLCFPPSIEFPSPSWQGKVDSIAQLYPREITGVLKELDIVAHSPHGLFGEECLGYRRYRKSVGYPTLTRWSEAVNTE